MTMLEVRHVTISYNNVPAVKDFSMKLEKGEICSLVGGSGCGKTTVIRGILGLLPPAGKIAEGEIFFEGESLTACKNNRWRQLRGTEISMIFQDTGSMMNPNRRIGEAYTEYIRIHEKISKADAEKKGMEMLARMGLPDEDNIMRSYPFQLSGGMRQRVGIAMSMTFQPKLLLADEPTSALDVTTQVQIVRQMMELRDHYGTAMILVTHNLGLAAYMSDRIIVMRNGMIEDQGDRDYILHHSENRYTRQLLDAVPSIGGTRYV